MNNAKLQRFTDMIVPKLSPQQIEFWQEVLSELDQIERVIDRYERDNAELTLDNNQKADKIETYDKAWRNLALDHWRLKQKQYKHEKPTVDFTDGYAKIQEINSLMDLEKRSSEYKSRALQELRNGKIDKNDYYKRLKISHETFKHHWQQITGEECNINFNQAMEVGK